MVKYVDLTHTLHNGIPAWDLSCGFQNEISMDYLQCDGAAKFRVQQLSCPAGIGTHMDAPAHCIPGAKTIDAYSVEECKKACVVIDVSNYLNKDYQLSAQEIKLFEKKYGVIPNDAFVIIYTGWSKHWRNPEKYHNQLVFPSVSVEAAEYLLTRNISGLGIDTLSPDAGDSDFGVHQKILGANKFIVENIANAHLMPSIGSEILILPLQIKDGTEAPINLVGLIN